MRSIKTLCSGLPATRAKSPSLTHSEGPFLRIEPETHLRDFSCLPVSRRSSVPTELAECDSKVAVEAGTAGPSARTVGGASAGSGPEDGEHEQRGAKGSVMAAQVGMEIKATVRGRG